HDALPISRFGNTAACQQAVVGQPLRTDVETTRYLVNRLVTEQGHSQHQPENLVLWEATTANRGRRGKPKGRFDPFDRNILREGTQITEGVKAINIEQRLLERHK